MSMRIDERWLWLGETLSPVDASVVIWLSHPGCYFISSGLLMAGPWTETSILRAVRVACTPTLDGCEVGPHRRGFDALEDLRPLHRGPRWQVVTEKELPPSLTRYEPSALEPVSGCCTIDDSVPEVSWSGESTAAVFAPESMPLSGRLSRAWNAHPPTSMVLAHDEGLRQPFVIMDLP